MNKKGFTLIELLVVIAVIATITAIAIVGLNRARDQSIVSRTLSDVRAIEKALNSLMLEDQESIWWRDTSFGAGADPSIDNITGLTQFLPKIPTPEIPGVSAYQYDNDGDELSASSQDMNGVNILINASSTVVTKFFDLMDASGDYSSGNDAGKLRVDSTGEYIFFNITPEETQW
ncbi:prepilin-type N-terminal cleavage/methylation domain-containing protein [Candidatus Falkowbacteria bacterium]|nr:prepilin-type N-terminal cleavage/methylation domain-containing protein [Candidatus Falkowbacteria bacterium]